MKNADESMGMKPFPNGNPSFIRLHLRPSVVPFLSFQLNHHASDTPYPVQDFHPLPHRSWLTVWVGIFRNPPAIRFQKLASEMERLSSTISVSEKCWLSPSYSPFAA